MTAGRCVLELRYIEKEIFPHNITKSQYSTNLNANVYIYRKIHKYIYSYAYTCYRESISESHLLVFGGNVFTVNTIPESMLAGLNIVTSFNMQTLSGHRSRTMTEVVSEFRFIIFGLTIHEVKLHVLVKHVVLAIHTYVSS